MDERQLAEMTLPALMALLTLLRPLPPGEAVVDDDDHLDDVDDVVVDAGDDDDTDHDGPPWEMPAVAAE